MAKESKHAKIETNVFLLIVLTVLTVSVGGLVEIVPLFFQRASHPASATQITPSIMRQNTPTMTTNPIKNSLIARSFPL